MGKPQRAHHAQPDAKTDPHRKHTARPLAGHRLGFLEDHRRVLVTHRAPPYSAHLVIAGPTRNAQRQGGRIVHGHKGVSSSQHGHSVHDPVDATQLRGTLTPEHCDALTQMGWVCAPPQAIAPKGG